MNPLKKAVNAVGVSILLKLLASLPRGIAEGRYGEQFQVAYLWAVGRKRIWSLALGCAAAGLYALDAPAGVVAVLGVASGALLSLGLIDASWRAPGAPDWLREYGWYQALARNAELVAGAFAFVAGSGGLLEMCGPECEVYGRVLLVVGVVLAHLGLLPKAWRSRPPQIELKVGEHTVSVHAHDVAMIRAAMRERARAADQK